jgi:spore coat protein CotH
MSKTHIGRWMAAVTVAAALGLPAALQGQGFGFGGETPLVERFDRNGDGRLDAAERKEARRAVAGQGGNQQFGRFFGGNDGAPPRPGKRLAPADVRVYPKAPLYDLETLRTIFLQFESNDWEAELADFNNTDVEVPATMIVDGRTYRDVGVHFRGASSFMMTGTGSKRSLNLSVDFVDKKQELLGYRTLNLLNAASDPTFLRAVLYTEIARQYIPLPRMNYMRVVINGENWGIYLNTQQFNKDLVRDYFGTEEGARWKVPGSPRGMGGLEYLGPSADSYRSIYSIRSKDVAKSWSDLIALTRVLNETPAARLEAALRPMLDIDGVLKFLALEVVLVNTDGYWTRASDYSLYQDPKGVFHVIPHDVNEGIGTGGGGGGRRGGFGGFGEGGPTLDPLVGMNDSSKPLRSKLLAVPALRERYMGYVRDIAEKLDWKTLGPMAEKYRALIAADVRDDTRKLYDTASFDTGVADIQAFAASRREYLLKR